MDEQASMDERIKQLLAQGFEVESWAVGRYGFKVVEVEDGPCRYRVHLANLKACGCRRAVTTFGGGDSVELALIDNEPGRPPHYHIENPQWAWDAVMQEVRACAPA